MDLQIIEIDRQYFVGLGGLSGNMPRSLLMVILGRIIKGKNIFFPDKSHFHHKLMDLNFDYKNILFLMYFYTSFSVFIGIFFLRN